MRDHVAARAIASHVNSKDASFFTVAFICPACELGVFAVAERKQTALAPMEIGGLLTDSGYKIHKVFPERRPIEAPEHTPDHVARPFIQALDNLRRSNWDAAGAMCRKALDVATKQIAAGQGVHAAVLKQRIDKLAAAHLIPPSLREWAHIIRDDGNDAAHDEDPFTESEASELVAFTELFLQYVFSLPGMLEERRERYANKTPAKR